mgnify:CR=1 FL=1
MSFFLVSRLRRSVGHIVCISLPALLAAGSAGAAENPLLRESTLPFGYPHFDLIKEEHFAPAYEQAIAEVLEQSQRIAAQAEEPTFENTIVALERSGRLLERVSRTFSNLNGTVSTPAMQAVEKAMAPKLAAQKDEVFLNDALFARVRALYEKRDTLGLDAESQRLLWRYYRDFVRAGANLGAEQKARLKAINAELASLQATFSQNLLKETNASALLVDTKEELDGLTEAAIASAAAAAKEAGHEGKFLLRLMNTTGQPPLAQLHDRETRARLLAASMERGSRGGEFDNRDIVSRTAALRAERAELLGYKNHAAYIMEDQTAGTPEAVNAMLGRLAPAAVENARQEAADIQALIDEEGEGFLLSASDWAYYAEKVRVSRFAFDESQLKPYFEMNRVLVDGVFFAAEKLYGITFKERHDLPVYEPSVRVFDVFDRDGSQLAIFIADLYARPSKRGGAWMNSYVAQSRLFGTKPVVANHLNVPKPPEGEPTLLTFDEVTTLFHEFGHALHGMFSDVQYPRFTGTTVSRDFVEYPSQVNEMWATWPEVLRNYAKHYQTGKPIPAELLEKVQASEKFNQGFATTEYLAAALLDQAWHQLAIGEVPAPEDVVEFEAEALGAAGVDFPPVPPRYRSTYFSHVFAGGYSAGYYSYIWAEVLDAESVEWFKQNGGLTRANGDHFRKTLLSRGGSADAMDLFRAFRGGEPSIEPLLRRRGLDRSGAE